MRCEVDSCGKRACRCKCLEIIPRVQATREGTRKETAAMIAIRKHGWNPKRLRVLIFLRVAILLSCAIFPVSGKVAAAAESQGNSSPLATQWNSHFVIGDFDGDSQPD